jgi:hypothetical protein
MRELVVLRMVCPDQDITLVCIGKMVISSVLQPTPNPKGTDTLVS